MLNAAWVCLLSALSVGVLQAQDILGDWHGTLKAGGTELHLLLHSPAVGHRPIHMQLFSSICVACLLLLTTGCAHTVTTKQPASPDQLRNDSFLDLEPGGRLRIVMPIVKPRTSSVITGSQKQEGGTIVLSASNLVGYSSSYYAIEARGNGKVRLRFASAEITEDGVARPEAEPPQLPFALPEKAGLIRLIYLLRSSQSDHNMAIVATAKLALLQTFTEQVQADPSRCAISKQMFCSWVPAGIAVRPESPQRSN